MGAYLDKPVEEKNPTWGRSEDFTIWWGACSMQGWRCGMEDMHMSTEIELPADDDVKACLFGVFDGHGGKEVAVFAEQ